MGKSEPKESVCALSDRGARHHGGHPGGSFQQPATMPGPAAAEGSTPPCHAVGWRRNRPARLPHQNIYSIGIQSIYFWIKLNLSAWTNKMKQNRAVKIAL